MHRLFFMLVQQVAYRHTRGARTRRTRRPGAAASTTAAANGGTGRRARLPLSAYGGEVLRGGAHPARLLQVLTAWEVSEKGGGGGEKVGSPSPPWDPRAVPAPPGKTVCYAGSNSKLCAEKNVSRGFLVVASGSLGMLLVLTVLLGWFFKRRYIAAREERERGLALAEARNPDGSRGQEPLFKDEGSFKGLRVMMPGNVAPTFLAWPEVMPGADDDSSVKGMSRDSTVHAAAAAEGHLLLAANASSGGTGGSGVGGTGGLARLSFHRLTGSSSRGKPPLSSNLEDTGSVEAEEGRAVHGATWHGQSHFGPPPPTRPPAVAAVGAPRTGAELGLRLQRTLSAGKADVGWPAENMTATAVSERLSLLRLHGTRRGGNGDDNTGSEPDT
eukprot:SM000003S11045  [mRNA]  locus=s3:583802:585458:- [translate_table: standard]